MELLAGQLILSSRTIGGLGVFLCAVLPGCNDADHPVQQPVDLLAERFSTSV